MRNSRLRFTSLRLQQISRGRSRLTISVRGGAIKLQLGYIALGIGDFIYADGVGAYSSSIPLLRTKRSVNVALELARNRFHNNFPSPNFTGKQILDILQKMEKILSDTNTYEIVNKDPIKKLTQDLRTLLVRWKRDRFIDEQTYRRLLTIDGLYNSPLYYLSLFLHNIINGSIPKASNYIKDSFHLAKKLNGTGIDFQYVLASLDIVYLFTNIPVVHDIILALQSDTINDALNIYNFLYMKLQFTLEVGTSGRLSFLDTKIILLSHSWFQQKNLIDAIHIFLNNCYPGQTKRKLSTRLHEHISDIKKNTGSSTVITDYRINFHNLNSRLSFFSINNKFNSLIKIHKNPLSNSQKKNIIYKISCKDCDATYVVEQTYHLFTKLKESLVGKRFQSDEEVQTAVTNWTKELAGSFYAEGISKLVFRYTKCIEIDGNYVEKD
ncbi:SETMR methyltransferase, partial [Acromyrmex insinuator]